MSRYVNKIEVKASEALSAEIMGFLQRNGLQQGDDGNESFWWKKGLNCTQHIILHNGGDSITVTAFIRYTDILLGTHHEKNISGWVACLGKRPLKKIIRGLEKLIKESGTAAI